MADAIFDAEYGPIAVHRKANILYRCIETMALS